MARSIEPFLMFEGRAEEAAAFYVSLFEDGAILDMKKFGPEGLGPEGSVMLGRLRVAGQTVLFTDSFVKHAFTFTPATSLFVECESGEEQERLVAALSAGGETLMPLDHYGFSRRFAWVNDRFGVSWQLNLP